jgi:hypothetical protein
MGGALEVIHLNDQSNAPLLDPEVLDATRKLKAMGVTNSSTANLSSTVKKLHVALQVG